MTDPESALATRETREGGWPLLTVETEANGDSKSKKEGSPSMVGSLVFVLSWLP
jgi:hypothetical protein